MKQIIYKKNFEEAVERLSSLYNHQAEDRIFAVFNPPSKSLKEFAISCRKEYMNFPDPKERAEFWNRYLSEKSEIEDDSLPSLYLSEFDQGLYGGLIGGEMKFLADPETGWISSMIKPLYDDIFKFDPASCEIDTTLYGLYLEKLKQYSEIAGNKYGISHFILIDSLNFVFELVGATNTYLSLIENPVKVKEAIDFAYELNVKIHSDFFSVIPSYRGGTFSNFAQWLPGRVISESIDPFHLTPVDYFEEWGREPVEKIFSAFDGGVIHIHSNGRHLLKAASSLKNLKAIYFEDEKEAPPAFEVLDELIKETGNIPLVVQARLNQFMQRLNTHNLPGNVLYIIDAEIDTKEINTLMEKVRQYKT